MTHTSDAIAASDFVAAKQDIEKEPEMQRESKNFWQDAWTQLKEINLQLLE